MTNSAMKSDAVISPCGLFRYKLSRLWGTGPECTFIMLNPSTADAHQDDPTIRRCISFAQRENCGGLSVVNLFAFRATSPKDMKAASDPIGPDNDEHLMAVLDSANGPIIAAWGTHGAFLGRDKAVKHMFMDRLLCLGRTVAGHPKHPLYLKSDSILTPLTSGASRNDGFETSPIKGFR